MPPCLIDRMSVLPRHPEGMGDAGLRMTADGRFALGQTSERPELIDGVTAMSPRATPLHQKIDLRIASPLHALSAERPGIEVLLDVGLQVRPDVVRHPDILVYRPGVLTGLPERLTVAPDLIVEVALPRKRATELVTKRGDDEMFGVRKCWTVGSADPRVRTWRRREQGFVEAPATGSRVALETDPRIGFDAASPRAPLTA